MMTALITTLLATALVFPPFAHCRKSARKDAAKPAAAAVVAEPTPNNATKATDPASPAQRKEIAVSNAQRKEIAVSNAQRKEITLSEEQRGFISASNAFAFESYRAICGIPAAKPSSGAIKPSSGAARPSSGNAPSANTTPESRIYSPLSVTYALGMLTNGASGRTREQITRALGFGGDLKALNGFCRLLLSEAATVDPGTTIDIANAVIANNLKLELNKGFTSSLSRYYDAEVSGMNFATDNVAGYVNGWCNTKTKGMIPKILDRVDPSYLCVLLNAIYFKGAWEDKFAPYATRPADFTHEDGSTDKVDMMHQRKRFAVGSNGSFQTIRLPYGNGAYRMYILLPNGGHSVADIIAGLTPQSWEAVLNSLSTRQVDLKLPKFETEYTIPLNEVLMSLGIVDAFSPADADFSLMSRQASHIDMVLQKARIKVNEEGTEAAAVTAIGMTTTAVNPSGPWLFHADHPFLYVITEASTGAIFFMGQYM